MMKVISMRVDVPIVEIETRTIVRNIVRPQPLTIEMEREERGGDLYVSFMQSIDIFGVEVIRWNNVGRTNSESSSRKRSDASDNSRKQEDQDSGGK